MDLRIPPCSPPVMRFVWDTYLLARLSFSCEIIKWKDVQFLWYAHSSLIHVPFLEGIANTLSRKCSCPSVCLFIDDKTNFQIRFIEFEIKITPVLVADMSLVVWGRCIFGTQLEMKKLVICLRWIQEQKKIVVIK